jgi:hypothetical protein
MKKAIFLVIAFLILIVHNNPLDCQNRARVLSLDDVLDCKDTFACFSDCSKYYPNCKEMIANEIDLEDTLETQSYIKVCLESSTNGISENKQHPLVLYIEELVPTLVSESCKKTMFNYLADFKVRLNSFKLECAQSKTKLE